MHFPALMNLVQELEAQQGHSTMSKVLSMLESAKLMIFKKPHDALQACSLFI